jgi:hypothetical protein
MLDFFTLRFSNKSGNVSSDGYDQGSTHHRRIDERQWQVNFFIFEMGNNLHRDVLFGRLTAVGQFHFIRLHIARIL